VGNKGFGEETHTAKPQTELNTGILEPLRRLAKTKGINGFQIFSNEGKPADGVLPKIKVGRDKFVTVLREIMESMRINSRRMTIGAFQESTLLLESQKLFFYDLNDCYLIVFSEKNLQDAWLRRKITEFVENNIVETAAP
jgi:predicted regulator of Ras-like GTPase activity (Roadblock/LC7/MglB family)